MLFLECCYDFTGNGKSQFDFVESIISQYKEVNKVEIKEKTIETDDFLKLMDSYFIHIPEKLDLIDCKERLNTGRGIGLELLTFYYYYQKYIGERTVEWNYSKGNKQFDVIISRGDKVTFVECKLPQDNLVEEAIKLKTKAESILKSTSFKKEFSISTKLDKEFVMAVWEKPSDDVIQQVVSNEVKLIVMSEIYNNDLNNKNQNHQLNHLFGRRRGHFLNEENDLY